MKKILFILSAFVLLFAVPLSTHADDNIITGTLYYPYSQIENNVNHANAEHYMYLQYQRPDSVYGQNDYIRYFTTCIYWDSFYDSQKISDNVYELTLSNSAGSIHVYDMMHSVHLNENNEKVHEHQYCLSSPLSVERSRMRINFENRTISMWDGYDRKIYEDIQLDDLETDIEYFDNLFKDITISIFPDIGMNFDYTVNMYDSNIPINLIQVDIDNHSDKYYQYCILIQPTGSILEYEEHSNSRNLSVFWGDSPVTYCLFKDEWFYAPVSFSQGNELINAPCAWHMAKPNSLSREQIYFEQMKLAADTPYTLKVLIYDLSNDSNYQFYGTGQNIVATSSAFIEVAFTKDFSVVSDTEFNPDQDANGAYSFDPNSSLDSQFDRVKGIYDKTNANVKITEGGTFSDVYKTKSELGASYNLASSSQSYNSLMSQSSSYFGLLRSVFTYMPDWVNALLFFGLIGIIIVFILKKLG